MSQYKSPLKYLIEFVVIVSGITASFWVEEYRESLQNIEEKLKVLNSLKIELDEIDLYCQERKAAFKKDSDIISYLISSEKNLYDSIEKLVEIPFEIEVAVIDYRGFQPPMNRYNSIINEGTLKFVESDSIKQLLSQLNNTLISYLNANVGDEKIIQQKIGSYIIENYPEIIMSENNTTLKNYYNILRAKINSDLNLKAYLKAKSRTMYVKNVFLDRYVETLVILRNEIERKL